MITFGLSFLTVYSLGLSLKHVIDFYMSPMKSRFLYVNRRVISSGVILDLAVLLMLSSLRSDIIPVLDLTKSYTGSRSRNLWKLTCCIIYCPIQMCRPNQDVGERR